MEMERKTLRVCTFVVAGAVLIRLLGGSFWENTVRALGSPEAASVLLFLETGRYVRAGEAVDPVKPQPVPQPADSAEDRVLPVFSASDASLVEIRNSGGYDVEASALLEQTLSWNLCGDTPTVLILHTHGTESYTKTENYTESSRYRTLDTGYNVVSVGDSIAALLEAGGIRVIHDRTLHDSPSYDNAYSSARESIQAHLDKYPDIQLVLDIHRDSMEDASGNQITYTVNSERGESAKLMMVMGSDAGGQSHPQWEENLALAAKLHTQLEKLCPGICRPIQFRAQRYNQDLSPGAVLIEVGAAGNTRQQALLAAEYLAEAVLALSHGSSYA